MTDLLTRAAAPRTDAGPGQRPLSLSACFAGVVAASATLVTCLALALVGWFTSAGGRFGQPHDALRVGADAWLLGLGGRLDVAGTTVTMMPLGLTLLCGYVAYRLGRWAGLASPVPDDASLGLGVVLMTGCYAGVTVVAAVVSSLEGARPHVGAAVVGAVVLCALGGGLGMATGSGRLGGWWGVAPAALRSMLGGAVLTVLLLWAAAAVLVGVALAMDSGAAANVLARLHTDAGDAAMFTLVVALVTPNAILLGGSYLLGPGFAVGAGTTVAPTAVSLGPVPAFPLLAALPDNGPTPGWTMLLVGLPWLVAVVAAVLTHRQRPTVGWLDGCARGLGGGLLAALALGALVWVAGGAVGPGRMSHVGAPVLEVVGVALGAFGGGGLVGGALMTWRTRRRGRPAAHPDDEPTVELGAGVP